MRIYVGLYPVLKKPLYLLILCKEKHYTLIQCFCLYK
jgi:hypothetical protein